MKRLIVGLYAAPTLLVIAASVVRMEESSVILCGVLSFTLAVALTFPLWGFARCKRQQLWPVFVAAATCLVVIASVVTLHWPLRARYILSRPALDQLAQDVRAGKVFVGPRRIGLFTIVEAEVNRHGIVCLWIDANPTGKTGLVQCTPDYVPFNLWSMVNLDQRWQFIAED
jgi:hypothetical protein